MLLVLALLFSESVAHVSSSLFVHNNALGPLKKMLVLIFF
jgi:hypothetical protein